MCDSHADYMSLDRCVVDHHCILQTLLSQTQLFSYLLLKCNVRRVWRYQRGNQNPKIEGQTTQWPKETGQNDKQQSTKHYT